MSKLQEVFDRIQTIKKEQKQIKEAYRDALANSPQYSKVVEELKDLKLKKKQLETDIRAEFKTEFTKLDDLKIDLESDREMLSDIALTELMKGETVQVTDQYENSYEPVFSVKFKKAN